MKSVKGELHTVRLQIKVTACSQASYPVIDQVWDQIWNERWEEVALVKELVMDEVYFLM